MSQCRIWSNSLMGTLWVAKDARCPQANSEDIDQPARMRRLIWVFAVRRCNLVGNVLSGLYILIHEIDIKWYSVTIRRLQKCLNVALFQDNETKKNNFLTNEGSFSDTDSYTPDNGRKLVPHFETRDHKEHDINRPVSTRKGPVANLRIEGGSRGVRGSIDPFWLISF